MLRLFPDEGRPLTARAAHVYPPLKALAIAMGVVIVALSLAPDPPDIASGSDFGAWLSRRLFGTPGHGDKIAHLGAYVALGFVSLLAFGRHRRSAATTLLALLVLGGALELLQAAGGVRTGDLLDMAANTAGAVLGVGVGAALRILVRRKGLSPV